MALKAASQVISQDFIDWAALAKETAAVVCTVLRHESPRDFGNGEVPPVVARIIVLTGSHAGEVYPEERILKAGIRSKLIDVGDDVVGRVGVYGARKAIGLEPEWDGDVELAEAALAKFTTNGNAKKSMRAKAADMATSDQDPPF